VTELQPVDVPEGPRGRCGPVRLTNGQRRTLDTICDTFAPPLDGRPSASELGVPETLLEAADANLSPSERTQLRVLLSVWEWQRGRRFTSLSLAERERVLLSWCDSRIAARRAAFQSLRKSILALYHMLPAPDGGPNPVTTRFGYPGPRRPAEDAPQRRSISPLPVERDVELECDVCVVGSGAGGGTAAGVLAASGLDVIVIEAGDHYDDADFDGDELRGWMRLYQQGGATATHDQSVGILAGACLGGGTVVNYTTSFRTPEEVRHEWARRSGVAAFAGEEFSRSLDAVCARLGINLDHGKPSSRDEIMRRGLESLDWHVEAMPRNVLGCTQDVDCGYCGFGCRVGAKQSTVKTWLADAHAAGARFVVRARAERVTLANGAATGIVARTRDGHGVTVRSRAVVAAAGSLHTPALLRRSGLRNANIGRHLRLHPVTGLLGVFDEEVRPWEGTMQALYSDQLRDLHDGYGVRYETTALHPGLMVGFAPWRGAADHAGFVRTLPNAGVIGVLLRDRGAGEVSVRRSGDPIARYRLSDYDVEHVRRGVEGAARILEAAGARRIHTVHAKNIAYEPGLGSRERFLAETDACGWRAGRCAFYSFHQMGTARMGSTPESSACRPDGETWDVRNLSVCDASTFPNASGVNPMVTIEAIAYMNANELTAKLR
jgi:long-chain-alcohol oxidase